MKLLTLKPNWCGGDWCADGEVIYGRGRSVLKLSIGQVVKIRIKGININAKVVERKELITIAAAGISGLILILLLR